MLLTPHTFVGLAVGAAIQNPAIAAPVSFALHFMGDLVPHWDFYTNTQREERLRGWRPVAVMFDLALGVFVGTAATLYALWVLRNANLAASIFVGGVFAVLPDALEAPYIFSGKEHGPMRFLVNIQKRLQFPAPLPWGVISQLLVVAACFVVLSGLLK